MELNTILMQLGTALFAGAFIGLQREMKHNASGNGENGFIWIRSSIFLAVLWVISTFFTTLPYLPVVMFASVFILLAISHAAGSFTLKKPWITSELVGVLIFWIGALIGMWMESLAIILTVILTSVNTFKSQIDNFIDALSHKEWLAALQLFVFSGAILPILPNVPITELLVGTNFELVKAESGILGLMYAILSDINLFKVWLFVLFISWISFVGYFLSKFIGAKWGIPIAAFLGALSSSTAVTLSLASQEKDSFKHSWSKTASLIFIVWILVWVATMMLRVILGVFVIGWMSMGTGIFLIPLSMSIVAMILAVIYMKKYNHQQKTNTTEKADIKLSSPFEIWPAIQFAWFYVMISVLMNASLYYSDNIEYFIDTYINWFFRYANGLLSWFGLNIGEVTENLMFYGIAFISGFADVDAVYIKVSDLVKNTPDFSPEVWVIAITIAVIMNTVVKAFYVKIGSSPYMAKITAMLIWIICAVGSIVTLFVVL